MKSLYDNASRGVDKPARLISTPNQQRDSTAMLHSRFEIFYENTNALPVYFV